MKNENLYEILDNFKTKAEAYKYFGFSPNSIGISTLKNIAESVGFNLDIYKERRHPKKHCLFCNIELKSKQYKFCSTSCAAKFNNPHRILKEETILLRKENRINRKLNKKPKPCKKCGQVKCNNHEVCGHTKLWFFGLVPFGFDINKFGTIDIHSEYYRIKELLTKEYFDDLLSPKDISTKYRYNKKSENILHILKSFGIKTRDISESQVNACLSGKMNTEIKDDLTRYQFKHGWHKTWNNKKIY